MPSHRCASALVAEALGIVCAPSPIQTLLSALFRAVRNTLTSASCLGGFRVLQTCLCLLQTNLSDKLERAEVSGLCLKCGEV